MIFTPVSTGALAIIGGGIRRARKSVWSWRIAYGHQITQFFISEWSYPTRDIGDFFHRPKRSVIVPMVHDRLGQDGADTWERRQQTWGSYLKLISPSVDASAWSGGVMPPHD